MTIEEMKQIKKEKGYSYAQISKLTGVPLGTVQKIFSGETTAPRYATLQALEKLFMSENDNDDLVQEEAAEYHVKKQGEYTLEDYYAWPEDQRIELIDGVIYDMTAPTATHQSAAGEIYRQIANFILDNKGKCRPFISPIDVQLDCDNKTMVQPDVIIVCNTDIIIDRCVFGAPDFVLEVLSPSTRKKDCVKKLDKYMEAGVREYWMVDMKQKKVVVYQFDSETYPVIYGFEQPVPVGIYGGKLQIDMNMIWTF